MTQAFWILAFLFALMPIKAYEAHFFGVAFLFLMLACIVQILGLRAGNLQVLQRHKRMIGVLCAFWLLAFVSVIFSDVPFISFLYFCFFSALPLTFFLGLSGAQTSGASFFVPFIQAIGVVFALLGMSAIVQYFWIQDLLVAGRVAWPLSNPNTFAGLLSLGFFASVGGMLGAQKKAHSNLFLLLAVLLGCAVLTTLSRGAFISGALFLSLLLFLVRYQATKHWRCVSLLLALITVFAIGMSVAKIGSVQHPAQVLQDSLQAQGGILASRPEIWKAAGDIIREHFWTGTGIGTFFLYYPEMRRADYESSGTMAHSDPLQFWSEMGVLAPFLFYGLVILCLMTGYSYLKRTENEGGNRAVILAVFCGLGALVLHSHITFHFYILPTLMLAGLFLSFFLFHVSKALVLSNRVEFSVKINDKTFSILKALAGAALFIWLGGFASLNASEIFVDRARAKMLQGEMQDFARNINFAGTLSVRQNPRAVVLASTIPLGILEGNFSRLSSTEVESLYNQTYALLEEAERLNPRLPSIYVQMADLEKFDAPGLISRASQEELFRKALKVNPRFLPARQALARLYILREEKSEALHVLKDGLKWPYFDQDPSIYYQETALLALSLGYRQVHEDAIGKLQNWQKDHKKNQERFQGSSFMQIFVRGFYRND